MTEIKISHEANQAARAIARIVETKRKPLDMEMCIRIAAVVQTAINASTGKVAIKKG